MSFETLSRIIKRPTETYILQQRKEYTVETEVSYIKDPIGNLIEVKNEKLSDNEIKDPVGNFTEKWEDIQELVGVIQHSHKEDIQISGNQSKVSYKGYFTSTFNLEVDKLSDYRIKVIKPYETVYFRINMYDPNNFLRSKQHHIELKLIEDKKYLSDING